MPAGHSGDAELARPPAPGTVIRITLLQIGDRDLLLGNRPDPRLGGTRRSVRPGSSQSDFHLRRAV